jgi:hypothetical protein
VSISKFISAFSLITLMCVIDGAINGPGAATPSESAERAEIPPAFAEAARAASRTAGVGLPTLMAQLAHESAFRTDARNAASTAAGPAQFLEGTWLEMIQRHGAAYGLGSAAAQIVTINGRLDIADPALKAEVLALRRSPELAFAMAGRYLAAVAADLARFLGRAPSEFEIRLGYLLGAGGAALLLKAAHASPRRSVADILPDAAKANPPLFLDTGGRPLGAAACLEAIRRALRPDRDWGADLELGLPDETTGDVIVGVPDAG